MFVAQGGCGTNRAAGYVTGAFGFLMNLSPLANWLLSCYCWQQKLNVNTHKLHSQGRNFSNCLMPTEAHTGLSFQE